MLLVSSSFSFILIGGRFPVDNLPILRSYLDITLILSSYLYLMDSFYFSFSSFLFMVKDILNKNDDHALFFHLFAKL